jgi:hypothetical protein
LANEQDPGRVQIHQPIELPHSKIVLGLDAIIVVDKRETMLEHRNQYVMLGKESHRKEGEVFVLHLERDKSIPSER